MCGEGEEVREGAWGEFQWGAVKCSGVQWRGKSTGQAMKL